MKNLKISTKLIILIILTSSIMAFIGIYGLQNITIIDKGLMTMYYDRVIPLKQLKNISDAYAVNFVDAINKANTDIISWNEAARELDKATEIVQKEWNAYLGTKIEGEERRLVAEATELRDNQSKPAFDKALDILRAGKDSINSVKLSDFVKNELYTEIEPFTNQISKLIVLQLDISKQIKTEADDVFTQTQRNSWIILLLGVAIGVFFAIFIINSINQSIKKANEAVLKLSEGDLTYVIKDESKDEIGVLLSNIKETIAQLKDIVTNIVMGADNIATASIEMSSTSQELSQGASEQASSAEEISSSMEEMSANIQQNTDNSLETEKIALKAAEGVAKGNEASQK